jgi:Zinc dependent phospholipase C
LGHLWLVWGSRRNPRGPCGAVCIVVLLLSWPLCCRAYSGLSHEAIIDSAWDTSIKPVLLKRFPNATSDELRQAHGYAYGGAIIQDLGYYPHGSIFFSDLAHYVRSGEFVLALIRDARESNELNDYAFALGALAHYAADNSGHPIATNRAVPILYPKLKKKYGDTVTYEDDPLAHVKTEFGFDVLEIAQQALCSGQLSRVHRLSGSRPTSGASLPGDLRAATEGSLQRRRQSPEFLSPRRQQSDSQSHAHCLDVEERLHPEGYARDYQEEISFQPLSRKL